MEIPAYVGTEESRREKLERAAVALFDAQLLTQAQAAEIAGLLRVEVFDRLGHYSVTPFQYGWEDAEKEARMLRGEATKSGEGYDNFDHGK